MLFRSRVAALGLLLQLGWLALHPLTPGNAPVAIALGLLPLLVTALQARVAALVTPASTVLVKGSRGMAMERVAQAILGES